MEIKAPTEPKRSTTPLFGSNHRLSQDQRNWFLMQKRAKGRGFIYIETDKHRMLIHQIYADTLNDMSMSNLLINASWAAPRRTTKEQWARLRSVITGGVLV
jgi:hypothetical protein